MKVAHIVPIPNLPLIAGRPIHMCLAPIAKRYPEYKNFYREEAENGSYVILDNGMFEDDMLRNEDIIEIAHDVKASEVVAPDYLGDSEKTISAVKSFVKAIGEYIDFNIMCVPHGKDVKALVNCFKQLYIDNNLPIHTFGFSYLSFFKATNQLRLIHANSIFKEDFWKTPPAFHLLGVAKSMHGIAEVPVLNVTSNFRSIDTSLAGCLTSHGQRLHNDNKELNDSHLQRPKDYFERNLDEDLLIKNMKMLEGIAGIEV